MRYNPDIKSLGIFLYFLFTNTIVYCQKNIAPVSIEIKTPRIKAVDLNNNLDLVIQAKLNEFFVEYQHIFNVIDRTEMPMIDEERNIHKSKKNSSLPSSNMIGTQIILETTIKNFKEKIDSACVVTKTDKGSLGKLNIVDTKISNCSLYLMTYTFDLEISAIDVETGSVIETITLNIGSEGSTPYNKGIKDKNELKKDCISRLSPCFKNILKESSLFVTKVNIPILGAYETNETKLEAKKLFTVGANQQLLPYNLKMDIIMFDDEKIGDETIQRQKIIGSGKIVNTLGDLFILNVSDGEKEIYASIQRKDKIFCKVGKNMLQKTCVNPLVKKP
jgi:hypothetical protein